MQRYQQWASSADAKNMLDGGRGQWTYRHGNAIRTSTTTVESKFLYQALTTLLAAAATLLQAAMWNILCDEETPVLGTEIPFRCTQHSLKYIQCKYNAIVHYNPKHPTGDCGRYEKAY